MTGFCSSVPVEVMTFDSLIEKLALSLVIHPAGATSASSHATAKGLTNSSLNVPQQQQLLAA